MSSSRLPWVLLALAACRPDFGLGASVVTGPRILNVVVEPPEARPGDSVTFTVFPADQHGASSATADLGFCLSPRPLVENNAVNADCIGDPPKVAPIAAGVTATGATLPMDGCLEFGPETPPQKPGQPAFRPRDPDITGGYYQPLRVALEGEQVEAIALARIRCNLPGASAQAAVAFAQRYTDNQNPVFAAFSLDGTDPIDVPPHVIVTLRASWPDSTAEHYLVHDRADDQLADRREAIRVSWFTTAGDIPIATSGRGSDDPGLDATSDWQTPESGSGTLWAVMRDDRGGTAIRALAFTIGR